MFQIIQRTENSVVADKVLIVGNVYESPLRLLSNRLDNDKFSYSTSILALVMANQYRERSQRGAMLSKTGAVCLGILYSSYCRGLRFVSR